MNRFQDRADAGRYLAEHLQKYAGDSNTLVLGLRRGGVVVAFEVARGLGAPMDIFLVRKLGVPGYEELAVGAIALGGILVINQDIAQDIRISQSRIEEIAAKEAKELKRREQAYRGNRPPIKLEGRTIIIVDDGLAALLFDLLTSDKERVDSFDIQFRFDINLLAKRLSGAAAALISENDHQDIVQAIVSRGGRPDMAGRALGLVRAPTLFIVGGEDHQVITLDKQAIEYLKATKKMAIVPGATPLFEEPEALESVADPAAHWFLQYLNNR